MADSTISLRVQQLGAEGVRNRIREINAELKAGKPVTKELGKEMKELSTQVNAQSRIVKLNERAWLDQHQTLQTTARIMSTVGSVARSVLAITTAFSVAASAFGDKNSSLVEAEGGLARAHRDLNAALQSGDLEKQAEAQESINVWTAKIKELKNQDLQGVATNILNLGATIALLGSSAVTTAAKIGGSSFVAKLATAGGAFTGLGAAASTAAIPILLIAASVAAVAAALYMIVTPGDQVQQFFDTFFPSASKQMEDFSKNVDDVFTMYIPNAFIFMANTALKVFNSVVDFSEQMVNGVIRGINAIISAVNSVASFLHLPTIATLAEVSFAGIKAGEIPYLQSRNWGANGPGTYSGGGTSQPVMSSNRTASGGGAGMTVIVNVNGDVSGEDLVNKVRDAMKDNLIDRGFTGY